jgi:hypothetical protein
MNIYDQIIFRTIKKYLGPDELRLFEPLEALAKKFLEEPFYTLEIDPSMLPDVSDSVYRDDTNLFHQSYDTEEKIETDKKDRIERRRGQMAKLNFVRNNLPLSDKEFKQRLEKFEKMRHEWLEATLKGTASDRETDGELTNRMDLKKEIGSEKIILATALAIKKGYVSLDKILSITEEDYLSYTTKHLRDYLPDEDFFLRTL